MNNYDYIYVKVDPLTAPCKLAEIIKENVDTGLRLVQVILNYKYLYYHKHETCDILTQRDVTLIIFEKVNGTSQE